MDSPGGRAWRRFCRHRLAMASGLFLAGALAVILLGPLFCPYAPDTLSDSQFAPPQLEHWLGTDVHGRDLLARVLYGARVSFLVGVVGAGVSLVIGVLWGAVAGYAGGRWDSVMMRTVDVLYSLPSIVFVIVLLTTLEGLLQPGLSRWGWTGAGTSRLVLLFVGLGAVSWLTMARIVRGQVLSLRTRGFVEASRVLGASPAWILWHHLLPNLRGVVLVYLALTVPAVILNESFLSFLGLGIQPPQASLGSLIAEGAGQINPIRIYWWMVVFPAGFLAACLMALNYFSDGLREAWDPRASS